MSSLFFFIVLLGTLVLVHELGHFSFAKLFGVQVFKFSIGFGPELFARRWGETRYALGAIPLGGFVRMAGEDDTLEKIGETDLPPLDVKRTFSAKPIWQRTLIIAAGPVANILLPVALFTYIDYGPQERLLPVAGTVFDGSPAKEAGLRSGDLVISVDGQAVSSFEEMATYVGQKQHGVVEVVVDRNGQIQTLSVNLEVRQEADELSRRVSKGRMGVGAFVQLPVVSVAPGSIAHETGMQSLDRVLTVEGATIERYDQLETALLQAQDRPVTLRIERRTQVTTGAFSVELPIQKTFVLARSDASAPSRGLAFAALCVNSVETGTPAAALGLERGDCLITLDGRPVSHAAQLDDLLAVATDAPHVAEVLRPSGRQTLTLKAEKRPEIVPLKKGMDRVVFGLRAATPYGRGAMETYENDLLKAFVSSVEKTASLAATTVAGLALLIQGELPFSSMGGPGMLFDIAGKSAERGFEAFLFSLAFISMNLAIVNLLPIPVLDGGHLLFLFIEKLRRAPVSKPVREKVQLAGLVALGLLMLAVLGNDVFRYADPVARYVRGLWGG